MKNSIGPIILLIEMGFYVIPAYWACHIMVNPSYNTLSMENMATAKFYAFLFIFKITKAY